MQTTPPPPAAARQVLDFWFGDGLQRDWPRQDRNELWFGGGPAQDASHAWAEAWVDELGWTGFDIANGVCPDDAYVRVAIGLDYRAAAPLSGSRMGAGEEKMDVRVHVSQSGQ